jgi:hypothetical protein
MKPAILNSVSVLLANNYGNRSQQKTGSVLPMAGFSAMIAALFFPNT